MIFEKLDPVLFGGMFRPAQATYEFDTSRQLESEFVSRLENFANAIETLTNAFGDPIKFNDYKEVVEVEGFVEKNVPKDSWYLRFDDQYRQIFLTNDMQMNYLTLVMKNITIQDGCWG